MTGRRVALIGATGAVGRELLAVLEEREFPLSSLRCFASDRSAGRTLPFRGESLPVEPLGPNSFRGIDLALFSAGAALAHSVAVANGSCDVRESEVRRSAPG